MITREVILITLKRENKCRVVLHDRLQKSFKTDNLVFNCFRKIL